MTIGKSTLSRCSAEKIDKLCVAAMLPEVQLVAHPDNREILHSNVLPEVLPRTGFHNSPVLVHVLESAATSHSYIPFGSC